MSSAGTHWLSLPRPASSARRRKERAATCPAGSRNQRHTGQHRMRSTGPVCHLSCPARQVGRPLGTGR
eukprot:scaffold45093_cov74-Phaeocystis_antarctica.AAC.2